MARTFMKVPMSTLSLTSCVRLSLLFQMAYVIFGAVEPVFCSSFGILYRSVTPPHWQPPSPIQHFAGRNPTPETTGHALASRAIEGAA